MKALVAFLVVGLVACDSADPAADASAAPFRGPANPVACANRTNDTPKKLLDCVTLDGVRTHQAAFQAIADANGETRADNTAGYTASVNYVVETLRAAGWAVERVPFEYPFTETALQQLALIEATYATGTFTGSGSGDVTGPVTPVDINLGLPRDNTSACEASDFAGFPAGTIALVQRGTCLFAEKAANAQAAGAAAVVIFNQGDTPGREGVVSGAALFLPGGVPSNLTVPVVGTSFASGVELAQAGARARVAVEHVTRTSENVVAESAGGDPSRVVVVGAHLDSVLDGPGINDNGSGSAAILETAVLMRKVVPTNKVRFVWWGAEELGLIGSSAYVDALSTAERDAIAMYLNFDMIGSPNYVRFVYDGDGSTFGFPGAPGSGEIEAFFQSFYAGRGLTSEPAFITGSDHTPFANVGIATGGVFTGAGGVKTPGEAAVYGGTAGEPYDPCYHLACDTFDNVSLAVLDLNADAVAASVLHFAMSPALASASARTSLGPSVAVPASGARRVGRHDLQARPAD